MTRPDDLTPYRPQDIQPILAREAARWPAEYARDLPGVGRKAARKYPGCGDPGEVYEVTWRHFQDPARVATPYAFVMATIKWSLRNRFRSRARTRHRRAQILETYSIHGAESPSPLETLPHVVTPPNLTDRERIIVAGLDDRKGQAEIAAELGCHQTTVSRAIERLEARFLKQ